MVLHNSMESNWAGLALLGVCKALKGLNTGSCSATWTKTCHCKWLQPKEAFQEKQRKERVKGPIGLALSWAYDPKVLLSRTGFVSMCKKRTSGFFIRIGFLLELQMTPNDSWLNGWISSASWTCLIRLRKLRFMGDIEENVEKGREVWTVTEGNRDSELQKYINLMRSGLPFLLFPCLFWNYHIHYSSASFYSQFLY